MSGFSLNITALVDTGSDKNILPLHLIPSSLHRKIIPDSTIFTGCGQTKAIGTLTAYIQAHKSNFKFREVKFYIVKETFPPILGKAFLLEHDAIKPGSFRIHGSGMEIFLHDGKVVFFPWTSESSILVNKSSEPITGPDSTFQPISEQSSSSTPKCSNNLSIEGKMDYLRKEKQIKLTNEVLKGEYFNKLVDLLFSKKNVFKGPNDEIGLFSEKVRIPTKPGLTKAARPRPIPKHLQPKVEVEIQKMLDDGIIEKCEDGKGFHSPLHIVPKKGNKIRICSDFKSTLNQCLEETTDIWNLPNIDCLFADVEHGSLIFSDLDINSAYWNLEIHEDDRYKTNFLYNDQLYQYVRLPFGMKFSGDSFCRSISKLLGSVKHQNNFKNYVDDILVHFSDMETHLATL